MHRAVSPTPVAAMLATILESVTRTLHRSFTRPVSGFVSSQKKLTAARSNSSRNRSSSGVSSDWGEDGAVEVLSCSLGSDKKGSMPSPSTWAPSHMPEMPLSRSLREKDLRESRFWSTRMILTDFGLRGTFSGLCRVESGILGVSTMRRMRFISNHRKISTWVTS